ncbi:MAG TPA: WXG100 family type VII secretion target [Candidatus Limnocylindrales bacterium]
MTGPGFVLDTAAATAAARAFSECSDNAKATLQQMMADVDQLRASKYSGDQAKALNVAVEGLDGDLKKLVQLLTDLSNVVNSTQTGYTSSDADIAQSIKAVGNVYDRLSG